MSFPRSLSLATLALALAACASSTPVENRPVPGTSPARADANGLTPVNAPPRAIADPSIRVGLVTDVDEAKFPRVDGGYAVLWEGGVSSIRRGVTIVPPLAGQPTRWAVRVATFSTRENAETEAERVRGLVNAPVLVSGDPAGMWRVFVGDFESAEAGNPLRDELLLKDYTPPIWVVRKPSAAEFAPQLQLVDDEGNRHTLSGRTITLMPMTAETIEINGLRYRGAAVLYVNDRGLLNVINELNLDDYTKGVVPGEMGPTIYDELEAQKAQAVAARTYAVKRLGEFRGEGYDICPTPACQVYKGFSSEHALSSQAVDATKGLVMTYEGEPIDALFSATCGGYTSDVETMFPGRSDPYLRRASCIELETVTLMGRRNSRAMTEMEKDAALFSAVAGLRETSSWSARDVAAAVNAANAILGLERSAAAPASSRRRDVLRYLSAAWGLDRHGEVLTLPEDRTYFFPATGSEGELSKAAAFLVKYGVLPAQDLDSLDLDAAMPKSELYALLWSWLAEGGAVREAAGRIAALTPFAMELKLAGGARRTVALSEGVLVMRRLQDRYHQEEAVPVMVSDRARAITTNDGRTVALIVEANYDGAAYDRTSSYSNWTRSYRAPELVANIAKRAPIKELRGLRPVETDESHRVAVMEIEAEGGRKFNLEGLQIRFAMELPDNLFTFMKTKDRDGVDRYTFFGKGWGHGTGMCQVGAYGMAMRGETFDAILKNYYTGIEIVPFTR